MDFEIPSATIFIREKQVVTFPQPYTWKQHTVIFTVLGYDPKNAFHVS